MIPEFGHFAIVMGLCFALLQGVVSLVRPDTQRVILAAVGGQCIFLSVALLSLIVCFLTNDMTVLYVHDHSHQTLPIIYRIGAAWGGHEGSLLLWCVILSVWSSAYALISKPQLSTPTFYLILRILAWVSIGFISFLLFTSNPFQRVFPTELVVGDDLTPVLQDPGLIFHPPMLYSGYVGFALAFAFAIAALWQGQYDKRWVRALRPWVILPWSLLSCGIVLGSWWAYRELGWGGWWFWDPVENASLLPWLAATGLLHTLLVSEKRNVFKGWTLLLAIVTFALSLLGTFLVRSGVLVSVHAFASDPTRGIFLLSYLTLLIGGSLTLYCAKIHNFYRAPNFALFSRETFLLLNSVFLLAAVATICLGTLYPIVLDALDLGKISVGEPYFNTVFLPIILPMLFLMGLAPHVRWRYQPLTGLWRVLRLPFLLSIALALVLPKLFGLPFHWLASLGMSFAFWIILSTLQYMKTVWQRDHRVGLQHWSMIVAHVGIAVMALGITVTKSYSVERQLKLSPGESIAIAHKTIVFEQLADVPGPNYHSVSATFKIGNKTLVAQQKMYVSHEQILSQPGISATLFQDVYIALGSPLNKGAWSVRIYIKPLVRWIWAGGLMLLLGGLLSLLTYRKTVSTS